MIKFITIVAIASLAVISVITFAGRVNCNSATENYMKWSYFASRTNDPVAIKRAEEYREKMEACRK